MRKQLQPARLPMREKVIITRFQPGDLQSAAAQELKSRTRYSAFHWKKRSGIRISYGGLVVQKRIIL